MTRAGLETGFRVPRFSPSLCIAQGYRARSEPTFRRCASLSAAASLKPDAEAERERAEYNT